MEATELLEMLPPDILARICVHLDQEEFDEDAKADAEAAWSLTMDVIYALIGRKDAHRLLNLMDA